MTMVWATGRRKRLLPHGMQKAVAQRAGVSESYVSNVVNGLVEPRTPEGRRTLRKVQVTVARALGKRVDDVFPPQIAGPTAENDTGSDAERAA